jgi:creatinine amidohydrolase
MHLEEATWTEVDDAETDLALLPTGSTEQHGPHAPLGTDRIAAETVAEEAAEVYERETGVPVAVAPAIPVGVSAEHRRFPGSLWVSEDTFRSYVRETVGSLAAGGFDRVVIVNGHGGNVDALLEVAGNVTRQDDAYAVPFTWFEHVPEDAPPMGHAGARETALLRAIAPDLVRDDRTEAARAGGSDRWGEWVEGVNLAYDVEEFAENGVVGDPTDGDEATGEQLLTAAVGSLSRLLGAVAKR